MKVAITSTGNSLESKLDQRFGRCAFFVFYDTENKGVEFIPNTHLDAIEGAGVAAAQLVASKGAEKVVSGEFGTKVKSLFDQLKIQLVIMNEEDKRVQDVIQLLNQ